MPFLLAFAALFLLGSFAPPALFSGPVAPIDSVVHFRAVPLDRNNSDRRAIGGLRYLGGWEMRSDDPRFGGISAMHVEGGEVIALSDAGSLIRFPLPRGRRVVATIQPLADGPGDYRVKRDRDVESMVVHGGHAWLGFERRNAIWRYRLSDWRSDSNRRPQAMRKWPRNAGAEAMVRLDDGRFIVFSEGRRRPDGSTEALLFARDPSRPGPPPTRFGYRAPSGYRITDAALLPDGRLLLLNRRFTLVEAMSAKLVVVDPAVPEPGETMTGREIATLARPLTVDNMEALSITREGARTILWIASDDNLAPFQRSLLMKFALADEPDR